MADESVAAQGSRPALGARIGIVGLGRMGARAHDAVRAVGAHVVAALDAAPEPFALSGRDGLRAVFTREPETFWAAPMDALMVMTTAPAHVPLMLEALRRGMCRILVEKAFATGLGEAQAAIAAAKAAKARIVVNHGRRYCPNYRRLSEIVAGGELGALRAATMTMGAGGLGCMGIHHIETFNRLFGGRPRQVFAVATGTPPANARGAQFDDPGAAAILDYSGDRRAMLEVADDTGIPTRLEFRFTFGRVTIGDEMQPWTIGARSEADRGLPLTRYGQPNAEKPFPDFRPFGVPEMLEAALHDLLGDGPVVAGMDQAAAAVETFVALRRSMELARPYRLPLNPADYALTYAIP